METKKLFISAIMATCIAMSANALTPSTSIELETTPILEAPQNKNGGEIPEYPGGTEALYNFIYENLKFPAEDKKKGVRGRVIVRFVVEKDGSADKFEIVKHGTPSMDKESLRVLKLMSKWKPGKKNGEPVAVSMVIPLSFMTK